ncbi:MAG: ribose-5-phosphate isomerase RpiA [Steroidobacteraceae bacterium]
MAQIQDNKKRLAAAAAIDFVTPAAVLGVGTGSTVNIFIELLLASERRPGAAVSSSEATTRALRAGGIDVLDLNDAGELDLYVDGADEATWQRELIKGGGGALTREKIVAGASRRFVCMIDDSKLVSRLGAFGVPVEVIPMAREHVARKLRALGGTPQWRRDVTTDNGNQIIDLKGLSIADPAALEAEINQIAGVVSVGIFATRGADVLLIGTASGCEQR